MSRNDIVLPTDYQNFIALSRYARWIKNNNWRYETEGGEPINEKPMRLSKF